MNKFGVISLLTIFSVGQSFGAQQDQVQPEIEKIAVVGQTPIAPHGNQDYLLGSVQVIDSERLERANAMPHQAISGVVS